ncbi:uncharacterized protein LOC111903038 isoform X1 [Lactuca sativa]|uniref:uncharacterized protein LOC111903038 isoform X1 n=1 Tax=Lactuca sativa TaxID=4236 RepID=UPI001C68A67C|nr:uncharacterized protein LOC111903038 isoform X1 [Lactuca sativa]
MMKISLFNAWLLRDLGWLMYTDARGSRRTWWLPPWSRGYSKLPFFHRLLSSFFTYICRVFLKFEFAALDSDDLLYLKEQMEAEEDAERLLRRTEKRAFAAFKKAASLADSAPASIPLPLRVEPKPKTGIRQQDLLKKVVEVKPKKQKVSTKSSGDVSTVSSECKKPQINNVEEDKNPIKSLLAAYESSDDDD